MRVRISQNTYSVGATPAFINNNLRGKQLLHCLKLSDSEFVIVDGDDSNLEAIFNAKEEILKNGMRIVVDDKNCQLPSPEFEVYILYIIC